MREDPANVRELRERAGQQQAGDCACGIERKLQGRRRRLGQDGPAALRLRRMHEHHTLAAVELVPYRLKIGMAEILAAIARRCAHAVDMQRVEGISDLFEAGIGIRQRQGRERAEAAGMIAGDLRHPFVAGAHHVEPVAGIVAVEIGPRHDRGGDVVFVHIVEAALRRSAFRDIERRAECRLAELLPFEIRRRQHVMMHVDAARLIFFTGGESAMGHGSERARGTERGQKLPALPKVVSDHRFPPSRLSSLAARLTRHAADDGGRNFAIVSH